jgi:hypothetical protein
MVSIKSGCGIIISRMSVCTGVIARCFINNVLAIFNYHINMLRHNRVACLPPDGEVNQKNFFYQIV